MAGPFGRVRLTPHCSGLGVSRWRSFLLAAELDIVRRVNINVENRHVGTCFAYAIRGFGILLAIGAVASLWQWLDEPTDSRAQQYLTEWGVISGIGLALSLFMCAFALLLATRVSIFLSLPAFAVSLAALLFAPAVVSAFITLFDPDGWWHRPAVFKCWAAGAVSVLVAVRCFLHIRAALREGTALETPA